MRLLYQLIRPVLFLLPAEAAHHLVLRLLRVAARLRPGRRLRALQVGHPSGVGLAAGMIKDPRDLSLARVLGVDFVEAGTLTRFAQAGNPRPRLFRLPRDRALINRFGFNNPGYHTALQALRQAEGPMVGVNLGKGKRTPPRLLAGELAEGVRLFAPVADFFVINLSSPNTPGLRDLLDPGRLGRVLEELAVVRARAASFWEVPLAPLYLKLHPDLDPETEAGLLNWLPEARLDGVVLTNTTVGRKNLRTGAETLREIGAGGLSGAPLWPELQRLLPAVRAAVGPDVPIIAVGGIDSAERAAEARRLGASALEVYSGLIYEGPGLIGRLRQQ